MSDPTAGTVTQFADQLRQYATHFAPRDWDYTRDLGDLKELRYTKRGPDGVRYRVKSALGHLFGFNRLSNDELQEMLGPRNLRERFSYALFSLRRDDNMPDGVLDGGNIITHWEETGEYLQYVQPSVGEMLADWMDAEPDNPHALKIAGEMRRINKRYRERLDAEQATA